MCICTHPRLLIDMNVYIHTPMTINRYGCMYIYIYIHTRMSDNGHRCTRTHTYVVNKLTKYCKVCIMVAHLRLPLVNDVHCTVMYIVQRCILYSDVQYLSECILLLLLLLSYHRRLRMILRSARAARGRRSG